MIANNLRRVQLQKHPQSGASPARDIEVEVTRRNSLLLLRYGVIGNVKQINLPEKLTPARADGLWHHTCFEAFVRSPDSPTYREFNFSPSRQWAAYRFTGYRHDMAKEAGVADPRIEMESNDSMVRLSAFLDLSGVPMLVDREIWELGLSAIIEDGTEGRSFWALAHPAAKPDFHHPESFVLSLLS